MDRSKVSSRTADPARNRLLANVGRDYFLHGKSKVQIAEDYGISRFQVASFIQEALERGIVRISIHLPDDEADAALASALGIAQVVTVGTAGAAAGRDELARTVADAVVRTAAPGDTIGVAWSRTLQVAVNHLPASCTNPHVGMAGAIATDHDAEGPRLLAGLQARAVWPLWAPLVVPAAKALCSSPEIRSTLERADALDVAVIAVGRWQEGTSTVWERVPSAVRRAARDAGAVAEISGRLLDAQGKAVVTPVEDMVVSASLDQIARAGHKIAVAYGADRADAVLSAVRAGLVDTLACDLDLHEGLRDLISAETASTIEQGNPGGVS